MVVSREAKKSSAYWSFTLPAELKLKSDDEYAEALRDQFAAAVRSRLRSSVPVGTMLSGGLDSSSIACMARKLLADEKSEKRLHTFSAVFDTVKECDERPFMNAVVRGNGVKPHFIVADNYGPFVDMDRMLQFYDEPVYGGNTYLSWLSYKTAKANGVGVILDGFDGDNTISHGLGYFTELAHRKRWLKLGLEVAALSKKRDVSPLEAVWAWYWFRGLNPWIAKSRFRSRVRNGFRRAKTSIWSKEKAGGNGAANIQNAAELLNQDFANRMIPMMPKKKASPKLLTERESHLANLDSEGSPFSLELLDRISGALSLEVRFPFWDKRLIEFCLSLPAEQKIGKGWTRLVMRRAMNGILPPEVQWRPGKTDMTPSVVYGLSKYGRKYMDEIIINNPKAIVDYVNLKTLREAYQRFLNSEASDKDVFAIQRSVSLALWLQKMNQGS